MGLEGGGEACLFRVGEVELEGDEAVGRGGRVSFGARLGVRVEITAQADFLDGQAGSDEVGVKGVAVAIDGYQVVDRDKQRRGIHRVRVP